MTRHHEAEARRLAIPLDLYLSIPREVRYQLRRFPEPIAQYWELDDFLRYLIAKWGLRRDSFRSFVFSTDRDTQKDRELLVAWFFGKFVGGLQREGMHHSLALPREDRGIDCYLRIINSRSHSLNALPIQVSDVPIESQLVDESNVERLVLTACNKAKAKPTDCKNAILLLHVLGRGEARTVNLDRFRARDSFEQQEWSYRKIILQTDTQARSEFCTLYCDEDGEHFRGVRESRKSRIIMGRTQDDEREVGESAKTAGQILFRI